jgi:hypothetical protein
MGMKPLNRSHIKIAAVVVCLMILLSMMVWVRALMGSMRAWEQGEALFQEKNYIRAVTFFDRSIHWYTPLNPYVERSAQRLWAIGTMAEKRGDVVLALIAFRTIRRGFYGIESVYSPGQSWIDRSDIKISQLSKHGGTGTAGTAKRALPPPPDIFWSLMAEVGLLGWLLTMGILAVRLFRRDQGKRATASSCIGWAVLSACFFGLWLAGLLKA